jgi:hypothetical protein
VRRSRMACGTGQQGPARTLDLSLVCYSTPLSIEELKSVTQLDRNGQSTAQTDGAGFLTTLSLVRAYGYQIHYQSTDTINPVGFHRHICAVCDSSRSEALTFALDPDTTAQ